jgi:hypothetical protein
LTVNYKRNFQYTTEDGKVDPVIEEKLAENWNSTGNSVASRKYDLATKNLQEIKSYWLSVKDKVFPK